MDNNSDKRICLTENRYMRGLVQYLAEWTRKFSRLNLDSNRAAPPRSEREYQTISPDSNRLYKGHLGNLRLRSDEIFRYELNRSLRRSKKQKVSLSGIELQASDGGHFWRIWKISERKSAIKNVSDDSSWFNERYRLTKYHFISFGCSSSIRVKVGKVDPFNR